MFLLWLRQFPWCGDQTPASVPPPAEGRSSPTNTPVFPLVPSCYWLLRGSIYSFPLVRYSCLLSAGVLHAFLCLKAYSWCICGERCTPRPPTPLPSSYVLPAISSKPLFSFQHSTEELRPMAKTPHLFGVWNAQVRSLIRELDPTCHNNALAQPNKYFKKFN